MSATIIPLHPGQPAAQPCIVAEDEWGMWPTRKPKRLRIDVHKGTAREWAIAFVIAAGAWAVVGAIWIAGPL